MSKSKKHESQLIVRCPDCGCRYYRERPEQAECIACTQALMRRATRAAEATKQAISAENAAAEYVEQRWDMSYRRSLELIESASAVENLRNSACLPAKESHVRELLKSIVERLR